MLPVKFCSIWPNASYQVSFGQVVSEEKIFRNRPTRNKNCLWLPCLLMYRDKRRNPTDNPPQMPPTKFWFICPSSFRGEDFQKLTNQKQELPMAAMFVNRSVRNEQSLQRTFLPQMLPTKFWFIQPSGFSGDSPLKPLGQIKQNFTGSIYGRSSIRFPYFIQIGQKTWSPWAILVSDRLKKKFSSKTRRHNELLLCRNDVWEILYKISIYHANYTTNMATIGSSCL